MRGTFTMKITIVILALTFAIVSSFVQLEDHTSFIALKNYNRLDDIKDYNDLVATNRSHSVVHRRHKRELFTAITVGLQIVSFFGGLFVSHRQRVLQRRAAEQAARHFREQNELKLMQLCSSICVTEWGSWSFCTKPKEEYVDLEELEAQLADAANSAAIDAKRGRQPKKRPRKKVKPQEFSLCRNSSGAVVSKKIPPQASRQRKRMKLTAKEPSNCNTMREPEVQPEVQAQDSCLMPRDTTAHQEALQKLEEELTKVLENSSSGSAWQERRENNEAEWASVRDELKSALNESFKPLSDTATCQRCEQNPSTIRCISCGPWSLICEECDVLAHRFDTTHERYANSEDGTHIVYLSTQEFCIPLRSTGPCSNCQSPTDETTWEMTGEVVGHCIAVTPRGRFDVNIPKLTCGGCKSSKTPSLRDIVCSGFWPGSSRVIPGMYIFSSDVMDFFHTMKMHKPGLSIRSFLSSLGEISSNCGRAVVINQAVFSAALREWRKALLDSMMPGCGILEKAAAPCPACHLRPHAIHVDGNRKVYRFNNTKYVGENLFGNTVIQADEEVDQFVKRIRQVDKKTTSSFCGTSHYTAAKSRSKSFRKLDETGLCVAACRHSIILHAINMHQGEIFPYPLFVLRHLCRNVGMEIQYFCQDVVCKFWPWLENLLKSLPQLSYLKSVKPFLSVMHGLTHDWSCQVVWGGRWKEGSGLTTGEEMELANSYLSTTGHATKYMGKAAREEELTCHILWWNAQKVARLPELLSAKYIKTMKAISSLSNELDELVKECPGASKELLPQWKEEIIQLAQDHEVATGNVDEKTEIGKLQISIMRTHASMRHHQYTMSKCADASKKRLRLRKKIDKTKKTLESLIQLYNRHDQALVKVTDEMVEEVHWPWLSVRSCSTSDKKKLVDSFELLERHKEEEDLLLTEMTQYLFATEMCVYELHKEKDRLQGKDVQTGEERGRCALLHLRICRLQDQLVKAAKLFSGSTKGKLTDLTQLESDTVFDADTFDVESDTDCDTDVED